MKELKQKNVEELYIHNRITFQRAFEKYIDTWRNRENWEINCSLCRIYFVLYCFIQFSVIKVHKYEWNDITQGKE